MQYEPWDYTHPKRNIEILWTPHHTAGKYTAKENYFEKPVN